MEMLQSARGTPTVLCSEMITLHPAPARLPDDERVYAIGDVHGCSDRLSVLHAHIAADLASRPVARATVIHLGDYIDRGPDSAGVIALAQAGPAVPAGVQQPRLIHLCGNHETLMLEALEGDQTARATWLMNGGRATLASWDVSDLAGGTWHQTIPAADIAFLRGLALSYRVGGYLFVHAGIHPARDLNEQGADILLWIREPFLSFDGPLPAVVVHGHTIVRSPVVRSNRIGIDTGAVKGGTLTCLVLEADLLGFLTA